jgi:hypothetical protein
MILEFTIDGDSSSNVAQTFTLPHSYTFRTLRLKHVIYSISNDSLSETLATHLGLDVCVVYDPFPIALPECCGPT